MRLAHHFRREPVIDSLLAASPGGFFIACGLATAGRAHEMEIAMDSQQQAYGYEAGEACRRNGCEGVIEEREAEASCSCHISPPCPVCTTPREHCPECEWDAELEQYEAEKADAEKMRAYWAEQREKERWQVSQFDPNQAHIRAKPHSSCSMIKEGVAPNSMEKESLLKQLRGTFGGRIALWQVGPTHTRFRYIAYTD